MIRKGLKTSSFLRWNNSNWSNYNCQNIIMPEIIPELQYVTAVVHWISNGNFEKYYGYFWLIHHTASAAGISEILSEGRLDSSPFPDFGEAENGEIMFRASRIICISMITRPGLISLRDFCFFLSSQKERPAVDQNTKEILLRKPNISYWISFIK